MPPVNELITINLWAAVAFITAVFIIFTAATQKFVAGFASAMYALFIAGALSFWFWVIYVAVHFISKYW